MNSIEQDDRPGLFIRSKSSILHEQVPQADEVEARGSLPKMRAEPRRRDTDRLTFVCLGEGAITKVVNN